MKDKLIEELKEMSVLLIEELKEMSVLSDKQSDLVNRLEDDLCSAIKKIESDNKIIVRLTEAIWSNDIEKIQLAKLMTQDYGWCFMCGMYQCMGKCSEA